MSIQHNCKQASKSDKKNNNNEMKSKHYDTWQGAAIAGSSVSEGSCEAELVSWVSLTYILYTSVILQYPCTAANRFTRTKG